ncbi:hypothetical protein JTB14_004180 [Gonioctena quinquepunctata]|nr:hypothetical protein JTB14_004180 [Gonioctena quinquepunctata]
MVGYCEQSEGYRLADPSHRGKVMKARNVIFVGEAPEENTIEDECNMKTVDMPSSTNTEDKCVMSGMEGAVTSCLGMEVSRNRSHGQLILGQSEYTKNLLKSFGMGESKPISTPMCLNTKLVKPNEIDVLSDDKYQFRRLIGGLMYLSADNQKIEAFSDADWANDPLDRRSYTGFVVKMGIIWESRKQRSIALFSTEAEYLAIGDSERVCFVRNLMNEIDGMQDQLSYIMIIKVT